MQKNHSTYLLLTFGHTLNNDLSLGYSFGVDFPADVNYTIGTYTLVANKAKRHHYIKVNGKNKNNIC